MRLTLMIVDDDERFRELVKRLLGTGVRVIAEAARGDDAVLLAMEVRPDVVLMDLDLPGLDGIAATRQIKAATPGTKVILVIPHEEHAYLSSTGKTGADALLAKRAVRTEILSHIRAVVGGFDGAWDGQDRRGQRVPSRPWAGAERRRPQLSGEKGRVPAHVEESSARPRPGELLEHVVRKASLVFDSFRQPLPAGVRAGVGPSGRRLLYKAGRYRVMLRLEPAADSGRLFLVGQILDEGLPKKHLHDIVVSVWRGRRTLGRTLTNSFGEFQLQADRAKNLRLSVEVGETRAFLVSLPPVAGMEVRS